jgi:hypothetical protein
MNEKLRIVDPFTVIAFYGLRYDQGATRQHYELVVDWFDKQGCPPDRARLQGSDFSGKCISYRNAAKQLEKHGFENLDVLGLFTMKPNWKVMMGDDVLTALWDSAHSYATLEISASVAALSDSSVSHYAKRCAEIWRPDYGIAYTMEKNKGPGLYSLGVNYGGRTPFAVGKEAEELSRVSKWGHTWAPARIYQKGLLRDVYEWNFLNRLQAEFEVLGTTLKDWISRDQGHGEISKFNDRLWLWKVDKEDIPALRDTLRATDIIPDLKPGRS